MPKFNVTMYCQATVDYQVDDAVDEEEAREKALQMSNEQSEVDFFAALHVGAFDLEDTLVEEIKAGMRQKVKTVETGP